MAAAAPLADILEADWQKQVVQLARTLGFNEIYHTFNSRKSAHGFPDLILLRERTSADGSQPGTSRSSPAASRTLTRRRSPTLRGLRGLRGLRSSPHPPTS